MLTTETISLDPFLCDLLAKISHRLVVVGSVARGEDNPGDLDLLFDSDNEKAYDEIRKAIEDSDIAYDSMTIGNWCFDRWPYLPVEILPFHAGPGYKTLRRRSSFASFGHLELRVGCPVDCPKQQP